VSAEEKRWFNLTWLGIVAGGGTYFALLLIPFQKNKK
jgi:hypothetical protein